MMNIEALQDQVVVDTVIIKAHNIEIRRLRRALDLYGEHLSDCGSIQGPVCTCGLVQPPLEVSGGKMMEKWQERVVRERDRLGLRYGLLCRFIETDARCGKLGFFERGALKRQADVMADYLGVLTERIARFKE